MSYGRKSPAALVLLLSLACGGCAVMDGASIQGDSLVFSYENAAAGQVFFVHSADNFTYHRAARERDGSWRVRIPLEDEFIYFYVVDGTPVVPRCLEKVADDFGSVNCVYRNDP